MVELGGTFHHAGLFHDDFCINIHFTKLLILKEKFYLAVYAYKARERHPRGTFHHSTICPPTHTGLDGPGRQARSPSGVIHPNVSAAATMAGNKPRSSLRRTLCVMSRFVSRPFSCTLSATRRARAWMRASPFLTACDTTTERMAARRVFSARAGRSRGEVGHQSEIINFNFAGGFLRGVALPQGRAGERPAHTLAESRALAARQLPDHRAFVGDEKSVVPHLPPLGVGLLRGSARHLDGAHEGFGHALAGADRAIVGRIHVRHDDFPEDVVRRTTCRRRPRRPAA